MKNNIDKEEKIPFRGSKKELQGHVFNAVKGSTSKLSHIERNDPNYSKTLIQSEIEKKLKTEFFHKIINWLNKIVYDKKKYVHIPIEDLLQVSRTVAWDVLSKYDYEKGELTTFITRYVTKALDDEVRNMGYEVVLPEHVQTRIHKIRKFQKYFIKTEKRFPEYYEIADALNMSKDHIIDVKGYILSEGTKNSKKNVNIDDFYIFEEKE